MKYQSRSLPRFSTLLASTTLLCLFAPTVATASFHLMQIEQSIGGTCGDSRAQAIQLRMRSGGQNIVSGAELYAYDELGENPVLLIEFPNNVTSSTAGSRILATTEEFSSAFGPVPDFTLSAAIPESYLSGGRLTFEKNGSIYWSLSWGSYTGSTTGLSTNDDDGDFGPSFAGDLPSSLGESLLFQGSFSSESSTNAADYEYSASALFTNNSGVAAAVDCHLFSDGFEDGTTDAWSP